MKQVVKKILGRNVIKLATGLPWTRRFLSPMGIRTTQGLFRDRTVSIQLPGANSLKLSQLDESYLGFQLFWYGIDFYEPLTRTLLRNLVPPEGIFLDLGAHLGFFSMTIGALHRDTKIIAFEPNPKNFAVLQANVAANELTNVLCEPLAISDQNGEATLYLTESDMSASLMKDFQAEDTKQIDQIKVRTTTLDSYVKRHEIAGPLVIKVDIEGHEPAFFRGAAKTIATHKPDIIMEVLYDQDPTVVDWLKGLGYRFYPVTDQGLEELPAPKLVKRFPFLFLNHLLSTRPRQQLEPMFSAVQAHAAKLDLRRTSKHFPKEQWPLLWQTES